MTIKMTKKEYDKKPAAYKGVFEGQPSLLIGVNGETRIDTVEFI